jgi:Ca2+-binding EF-hand superfamily protein
MNSRLRFFHAALALGSTVLARAESVSARPTSNRPLSPVLAALDSNHDGILSAQEIAAAPLVLAALDLNGDGVISSDERRAMGADGKPVRVSRSGGSFNLILTLDANHDGDIQTMEIANAVSSLKLLDRNGDGALTAGELRPMLVAHHRS